MRGSGCKFTKIKDHRELSKAKESFIHSSSIGTGNIDICLLEDRILMEESQKKLLREQIDQYKKQISQKTKQLINIKTKIK